MPQPVESIGLKLQRALRLSRAVRLVWQSARAWTIAGGALLVVQGVLPLLPLYLMKLMVDAVSAGVAAADKGAAFRNVATLVVVMAAVAVVSALTRSLASLVSDGQSMAVADHMNGILHAKSIEADLEYYESPRYYDSLRRAQQEAPFRPTHIVNGLVRMGQNGISLLAIAGLLVSFGWTIALILFVAVIPGVAVQLSYADKMYRWQREQTATERQAAYLNAMLTGSSHAKEVRLFDLGPLFVGRFRDLRQRLRRERLGLAARRSAADVVAQISATAAIYGSLAFITYRTVHGVISLGDLVMYFLAFQRGQGFLQEVLGGLAGLYEDSLFLSNLYEFLDLKRTVPEPAQAVPVPRPMRTGIVLDHVSFSYAGGAREVLRDVSLAIHPGEVVALVGENGSGKTTLIKLLCRLYDPTGGTITLDGLDLRRFNTAALRRELSVLFQDYNHYHLSARENIGFGNTALPVGDERIVEAARQSGADAVVRRLPLGYDTVLGKLFDGGEELSVGEWQKVALARAFLRDAQVVVLDEPTSAMDAKAESAIFESLRQYASGRTVILISHRFSTVRMADSIYMLQDGRITEGGTHDELVRAGGTYARLFDMQAQHYR